MSHWQAHAHAAHDLFVAFNIPNLDASPVQEEFTPRKYRILCSVPFASFMIKFRNIGGSFFLWSTTWYVQPRSAACYIASAGKNSDGTHSDIGSPSSVFFAPCLVVCTSHRPA